MKDRTHRKDIPAFLIKLTVSLALLAYIILKKTSVPDILRELRDVNLYWILASFSLHALGVWISAVRWRILIQAQGDSVPLIYLVKSYLVGTFFNNFLPSRFGGDIVRIWDGSLYSRTLLRSSAVVLVERLTGVLILLLLALTASLIRLDMAREFPVIWLAMALALGGLGALFAFLTPVSEKLMRRLPESGFWKKLKHKTLEFREVVLVYRGQKGAVLRALFWALLLQINVIVHYYLAGKGFHLEVPLLDYFIFIPVVLLVLTIPITIGGLGVREGLYIQILGYYAIPASAAVAFSLIADTAFTLAVGLIGAVVYITRKKPG
ncbi:MAG: lysylphosphatidylglycerol synthase transmembrane domain-containing protein [Candidatus Aminicenantaceae bacterium]